jgi:putative transposase
MARSTLAQEWFSASELAAMAPPGLPTSARGVAMKAEREAWVEPAQKGVWWRERAGRGGGIEYHLSVLPLAAQAKLSVDLSITIERVAAGAPSDAARLEMWTWFDRQTDVKKDAARERLLALHAVRELTDAGVAKTLAAQKIAEIRKIALSSLYAWEKLIHRVPRADWLPFLAPRHAGQVGARVDLSPEAWDFITAEYLRPERPTISACYRRLERAAAAHGWSVPCEKTVSRKLQALAPAMVTLARQGKDALKAMYPAQRRDRSVLHALEVVNADFHTWDVFVRFPDGSIDRPNMVCFQDIYSGRVLSWRIDRHPNKQAVRLCFGDLVERFGVPDHCVLDNGREFASKWITGGTPNRYRFKVKDEEPEGLLVQMGVKVHWATPYAGQSKPIERAFRDMAGDTAKHPAFAGAYVGNKVTAKPENYGNSAVPFDTFLAVLQGEIAEHNSRTGRTGGLCAGRSFDATFDESYASASIRKASPEQRRLWLMAAEARTVDRVSGQLMLEGNRFWSPELHELRGQKVVVRFDPINFRLPLHVYRPDGAYLGAVPCIADVGFLDADAAREHGRNRKSFIKATIAARDAELKMTIKQVAAALPAAPHEPEAPETKVVRGLWGNTARQLAPEQDLEEQTPAEEALVAAMRRPRQLRVVENGDD